jgi:ABC-type uncharacterized transport system substrate-binding protein
MFQQFLHRVFYLLLCSAAALTFFPVAAQAAPYPVTVILSDNGGVYKEFSDTLSEYLQGSNVTLTVIDTLHPQPPSNLVVAVGIKAATAAAESNAPNILNVMIPKSGHKKLLLDFPKRNKSTQYSTIYLDQPLERQLSLIAAAFPDRNRLGVMFEAANLNEINQLKQIGHEYGFELYEREVAASTAMFDSLQDVLQHSDILLALPAPAIYNSTTLRNILVSTYQSNTPLVGFSSAYVKAGAMCAVISTPAQLAIQTSTIILKHTETGALPPAQAPKLFEIAVNERVAQSMGITIKSPDELLKKMSLIKRRAP